MLGELSILQPNCTFASIVARIWSQAGASAKTFFRGAKDDNGYAAMRDCWRMKADTDCTTRRC
jgi:hypothetical protein